MKNLTYLFTMIFVLVSLTGCKNINVYCHKNDDYKKNIITPEIAEEVYLYALLSDNSYEKENNDPWDLSILPIKEVENTEIDLKLKSKSKIKKNNDGSRVFNFGSGGQAKIYEKYEDKEKKKLTDIIIAFRGTQWFVDVTGSLTKKQRNKAVVFFDTIKKYYKEKKIDKDVKFIVCGHSLGGALALEISSIRGVDAYVFNSSFATSKNNPFNAKRIHVKEQADFLNWLRIPWTNPVKLITYKVDFTDDDNHSISNLASGLLEVAAINSIEASEVLEKQKDK